MGLLVAIREADVRAVDVEGGVLVDYGIRRPQHCGEGVRGREAAVGHGVQVREVEHGTYPGQLRGDLEDVLEGPELAYPTHDLDTERDGSPLRLEALAQLYELLDDRGERVSALAPEQEARMEDDCL